MKKIFSKFMLLSLLRVALVHVISVIDAELKDAPASVIAAATGSANES